jgi:hypothetical protein
MRATMFGVQQLLIAEAMKESPQTLWACAAIVVRPSWLIGKPGIQIGAAARKKPRVDWSLIANSISTNRSTLLEPLE